MSQLPHIPVLPSQIQNLIKEHQPARVLDFTFGAGGHSRICLENSNCILTAFDRDGDTVQYSNKFKEQYGDRFHFYKDISSNIGLYVEKKQDFILGDLGLSQMQLASDRGFAYNKNSNLEMSMGVESLGALKDIIKNLGEEAIYNILMEYGEEPQSRRISRAIYLNRMKLNNSDDLKRVILDSLYNHKEENKVLSRCFQAFRIYINQEISTLEKTLTIAYDLLNEGGVLAIITFHSLEDRAVKIFFKHKFKKSSLMVPTKDEMDKNSQSRSAKLRVGIKH